jgi:hypothetical protein
MSTKPSTEIFSVKAISAKEKLEAARNADAIAILFFII